jgi:hypothetical protein
LRKIPVLRLNFSRHSALEIFRLSTGNFCKYPSQAWYICIKCTIVILFKRFSVCRHMWFCSNASVYAVICDFVQTLQCMPSCDIVQTLQCMPVICEIIQTLQCMPSSWLWHQTYIVCIFEKIYLPILTRVIKKSLKFLH